MKYTITDNSSICVIPKKLMEEVVITNIEDEDRVFSRINQIKKLSEKVIFIDEDLLLIQLQTNNEVIFQIST